MFFTYAFYILLGFLNYSLQMFIHVKYLKKMQFSIIFHQNTTLLSVIYYRCTRFITDTFFLYRNIKYNFFNNILIANRFKESEFNITPHRKTYEWSYRACNMERFVRIIKNIEDCFSKPPYKLELEWSVFFNEK